MKSKPKKHTGNEAPCSTLLVSVSGGRTSAMMARMIQVSPLFEEYDKKIYIYANTGKEKQETLDFIHELDVKWGLNIVWVEAVIHHENNVGTTHRIIDYGSAVVNTDPLNDKNPFHEVVQKYGVFNGNFPHCTRELKTAPIRSYMRSLGLEKKDYIEAWGFRYDEPRRLRERTGIIYPLAELKITDRVVREYWNAQDFDLKIKQYEGNCDLCFKKSLKKKLTILKNDPQIAKDWEKLEQLGTRSGEAVTFDRNKLTISNLVEMSKDDNLEEAIDKHDENLTQPELYAAACEINWDFETHCHCH